MNALSFVASLLSQNNDVLTLEISLDCEYWTIFTIEFNQKTKEIRFHESRDIDVQFFNNHLFFNAFLEAIEKTNYDEAKLENFAFEVLI